MNYMGGHVDGQCSRCGRFHVVHPDPGPAFCRKLEIQSSGASLTVAIEARRNFENALLPTSTGFVGSVSVS